MAHQALSAPVHQPDLVGRTGCEIHRADPWSRRCQDDRLKRTRRLGCGPRKRGSSHPIAGSMTAVAPRAVGAAGDAYDQAKPFALEGAKQAVHAVGAGNDWHSTVRMAGTTLLSLRPKTKHYQRDTGGESPLC